MAQSPACSSKERCHRTARNVERAIRAETRKLDVLNRTGAALAAELDVDRIVQIVTDACTELVGAQFGAFFYNVVNDKGESYMLYALSGVPREKFSQVSDAAKHSGVRSDIRGRRQSSDPTTF